MTYDQMLVMISKNRAKAVAVDWLTIDQHLVTVDGGDYLIDFKEELVAEV